MKRFSTFLITVALIGGMVGCGEVTPPARYNLTMAVAPTGSGDATDLTNASPYTAGTVINITAAATVGYQFVNWTASAGTFGNANAAQTTFTMPAQHVTVTADFAPEAVEIRTWYDLDAVRNNLDVSYILMNNLDSSTPGYVELASPTANQGMGWHPVGSFSLDPVDHTVIDRVNSFTGSLDGQGYEIRDLFINRPDKDGVGLFGCVSEGMIENLSVMNAEVTGRVYVGGLVGENSGTVRDSHSTGSVTGTGSGINYGWVGGLVGFNALEGTVTSSYWTGGVRGWWFVGGLVGANDGTLSNSYSTGNVSGGTMHAGGLVGVNWRTVDSCYSTGSVTGAANVGGLVGLNHLGIVRNSYSTGTVSGDIRVGGLAGENADAAVDKAYSTGSVIGDQSVGGLVGWNGGDRGSVSDSYSSGNVIGDQYVGGLVGYNEKSSVNKSYSTGNVKGNTAFGGLVGLNNEGTISDSFWDTQTSGQSTSAGATIKTTAEMRNITTFSGAGWNMVVVATPGTRNASYIWNIVDGQTYPFLSWQA